MCDGRIGTKKSRRRLNKETVFATTVTTEVVGWGTGIGQIVGFVAGILMTAFWAWITGPVPWRLWEFW